MVLYSFKTSTIFLTVITLLGKEYLATHEPHLVLIDRSLTVHRERLPRRVVVVNC